MVSTLNRDAARLGLRKLGAGIVLGSLIAWSGVAGAAPAPESFSGLAKTVAPAVVNIAAAHKNGGPAADVPDMPFSFPPGSPFEKFFKEFQDRAGRGGGQQHAPGATALGSGFIVDPEGYVVTNNHVIDGASTITVRLDDDKQYPAKLIGTDPDTDLALLKIEAGHPLPSVRFGDSDKAEVGDWVLAVGNPFGLGGTVTAGIISARNRNIQAGPYDDFLQIDAPINRGNSGGPLFGMDGSVIGINAAIYSPNGGSVGIGFSIPSNLAKTVVAQLRATGKVERGWLGVHIQPVTAEIASALGLASEGGALVTEITPDSPAAKAGLRQGDAILGFAGQDIADPRELARQVGMVPAGKTVAMKVWRDGKAAELNVVLGLQPTQQTAAATEAAPAQGGSVHSDALGLDLVALTPDRRAELGIADGIDGVIVVDVGAGPAQDQGLRPGDIIRQIASQTVTAPEQIDALVSKARSAGARAVLLMVNRGGSDLFVGLKLGVA